MLKKIPTSSLDFSKKQVYLFMLKDEFPSLHQGIYLNTPASGLLSRGLLAWRRQHDQEYLEQGSAFRAHQEEIDLIGQCKNAVSSLFKGDMDRTYIVPNFSLAFTTLLDCISKDQKFLYLEGEYPSISYPIESRQLQALKLSPETALDGSLEAALKEYKPHVLVFSIVQYTSGLRIDLDLIKQIRQQYPELLIIADGTQFCGTEEFDFSSSGIDVLISSGYKWMLAGYGNGFVMLSKQGEARLQARFSSLNKPQLPHLKDKTTIGLSLEPGHQDTLAVGSLKYAAEWLISQDYPRLCATLHTLRTQAFESLSERGLLPAYITTRHQPSCIFSLPVLPGLEQGLQKAGIVYVQRAGRIRVGFHIYNTAADLETLLRVIDAHR